MDAALKSARDDALTAFGLTQDNASAVIDLADAARSASLADLIASAQQAAGLQGARAAKALQNYP